MSEVFNQNVALSFLSARAQLPSHSGHKKEETWKQLDILLIRFNINCTWWIVLSQEQNQIVNVQNIYHCNVERSRNKSDVNVREMEAKQ